ncbi:DUF421 domain-containing protein [Cohnella zeiphila]|uniref:DUF421 domain-containing protein n=1 Tax=Cohnella zeiphila TaxID=2761120 RepID=A0A7X0W0S9_9BACL|nr:DUF421 domain-containing protein [Cohnella zeiphila]MBB6735383.1 DUF421 domain-containing protein [Cohnella zeiphila]
METIGITTLRTLLGFAFLLLLTRILGKKQLGQVTYFTYITGIALGNIAGELAVSHSISVLAGMTGLAVWAMLTLAIELISLKSPKARVLLDGEPAIVIKKGRIEERALRKSKLNMDDLTMLLRDKDVFNIREVDYAIFEPNGRLSVLKKQKEESVKKKDLQIAPQPRPYLPTELIVDGKVVARNLQEWGLNREWLDRQLEKSGARSVEDVFYAELESDGSLFVAEKRQGRGSGGL